ncbi:MAG: Uma2 family endonuclease [Isosphaeraceae bacterium]
MSTQTRLLTADEFLVWPDEPGMRQELIRGEIVMMSLARGEHGEIALEIGRLIANHVKPAKLGKTYAAETGFIVERGPDTVRGADVAFVRSERVAAITQRKKHIPFAPDLAVEVLSPNDRDDEVEEKIQLWLKAGSLIVWSVDPGNRTVTVYRPVAEPVILREEQEIDGGDVIPGFHCRVADFFA